MRWAARKGIRVNRIATVWLIRCLLDPEAEIQFVEPDAVAGVQEREGAIGFDAPRARYPHQDKRGRCSFEQLVGGRFPLETALSCLAQIVHGADFPEEAEKEPEAIGLWAISQGFGEVARDDEEIAARAAFLYDSLYAHLRHRTERAPRERA